MEAIHDKAGQRIGYGIPDADRGEDLARFADAHGYRLGEPRNGLVRDVKGRATLTDSPAFARAVTWAEVAE